MNVALFANSTHDTNRLRTTMSKYQGFRRPERIDEMISTVKRYGGRPPLVDPDPIHISKVGKLIDRSVSPQEGGQGFFAWLKNADMKLGVKIYKPSSIESVYRIQRANRIKNALEAIRQLNYKGTKAFLLFNTLNIPRQHIVDSSNALAGLLLPAAPSSCYIRQNISGKNQLKCVTLGDVISFRNIIPSCSEYDYDPLPPQAKWSLLDSLSQAIASLHHVGLIHADISSNNVFIRWPNSSDPKAYVIDAFNGFGVDGGNEEVGYMHSDVYCPTSLRARQYTPATDVYCLGWWIAHIGVARNPEVQRMDRPSLQEIRTASGVFYRRHEYVLDALKQNRDGLPVWLYDVVSSALEVNPDYRPTSRELTYAVHDYWLNFGDTR